MADRRPFEYRFRDEFPGLPDTVSIEKLASVLSRVPEVYQTFILKGLQEQEGEDDGARSN